MNTKAFKPIVLVAVLSLAILAGCAPSSHASPAPETKPGMASASASANLTPRDAVYQAYMLPTRLLAQAQATLELCVHAVFDASLASGRAPTTAGTYRYNIQGKDAYTPSPQEELVVSFPRGAQVHLKVFEITGDFHDSADRFLDGFYSLSCQTSTAQGFETMVVASHAGNEASLEISGTIHLDQEKLDVNLSRQASLAELGMDPKGGRSLPQSSIQGVIAAGDFMLHVHEKLLVADMNDPKISLRIINNSWMVGPDQYQFQDASVEAQLRDGQPVELADPRQASGLVLRNGQTFGWLDISIFGDHGDVIAVIPDGSISMTPQQP